MRAARENCELPAGRRAIRLGPRLVGMTSMGAHARGSSRGAEQNTNIFLTAYAGHGIVSHSGRMAPAAMRPLRAAPAFQTYPACLRARAERAPALASPGAAGYFQPNWGAPALPINTPNPLLSRRLAISSMSLRS